MNKLNKHWSLAPWGLVLAAGLLLGTPWLGMAQLALELQLASSKVALYESITASITLHNQSGRVITFGAPGAASLRFAIEKDMGRLINPRSSQPLLSALQIMPGETFSPQFDLARLYAIRSLGTYKVRALVDWAGTTYASAPVRLDVVRCFELTRLTAGLPDEPMASRTYVLEYLHKDSQEEHLYLRIEDEQAGEIYGVFNLGRVVRVRPPTLQLDESGNVHVLFQIPGAYYCHAAFTPYGVALASETHPGGKQSVELTRLPNGRVAVVSRLPAAPAAEQASTPEEGPITKVKKSVGGLFGKPRN